MRVCWQDSGALESVGRKAALEGLKGAGGKKVSAPGNASGWLAGWVFGKVGEAP